MTVGIEPEPELTAEEQSQLEMCDFFIYKYFEHSTRYEKEHSSYGLKHQVEHFFQVCAELKIDFEFENTRYVSHKVFKIAMDRYCYTHKPDWTGNNRVYKYKYIGPKIWNGIEYYTPMTWADWNKVLNVKA